MTEEPKAPLADCALCPGKSAAFVPPTSAKGKVRLAIVAESPNWNELREGGPLAGPPGKLLENIFRRAGFSREEIHFSKAVLCNVRKDELDAARNASQKS
jgi:uracil-DNA glycosylase family 4